MAPDEDLIYASARDITPRMRIEAALEASESQTRQILETAHDAFVSIDAGGRIIDWNPQAHVVFGWTREEALGRELAETIIPERLRRAHRRGLERFLATGKDSGIGELLEVAALHRDGREFPIELSISPARGAGGYSFNAFLRDVSERQKTQQDLATAHARALESSRLKSEFVANMSHEIRTPLNGVIGMSGLLLDTELSAEQREYVDAVRLSGDALMSVINDVLDFSKIEAGKLELDQAPFHLRDLAEDVCSLGAATAQAKGVELMSCVDDRLPPIVSGDGDRIRQVLSNLTTNAVKFTATGEVVVQVTEQHAAGEKLTVRFEVADTGIGIDPAAVDKVFESFAQADGSTTRRYGGTGLGLTISEQLVGLMGGEIGVDSKLGKGSTFWFTVPVEDGTTHAAPPDRGELSGVRALVVVENPTSRGILERQLSSWGIA